MQPQRAVGGILASKVLVTNLALHPLRYGAPIFFLKKIAVYWLCTRCKLVQTFGLIMN